LTDAYRDGALVLQSAIRKNFKFSAEKFVVSPQVTFSGLFLSSSPSGAVAIYPDLDRVWEFIHLKTPDSKEDLRSLMGLLATFHKWNGSIAKETVNMRKLLMKGVRFDWNPAVHGVELEAIKCQMKELLPLSPFDPSLPSHIFTDASLLGFGYCLLQLRDDQGWNVICSGSTGIKEHQKKLKPYDLELTGIVFACQKLHYYMSSGLPFTINTDHKALDRLEFIDLDSVISNRVMRSLEIILSNNVQVKYIKKSKNKIADYLSRIGGPEAEAPFFEQFLKVPLPGLVNVLAGGGPADPLLVELSQLAGGEYEQMVEAVWRGDKLADLPSHHPLNM